MDWLHPVGARSDRLFTSFRNSEIVSGTRGIRLACDRVSDDDDEARSFADLAIYLIPINS